MYVCSTYNYVLSLNLTKLYKNIVEKLIGYGLSEFFPIQFLTMDDSNSDDSLDEFCSSYATFAKKTYEVAVERALKAKVDEEEDILLDDSFAESDKAKSHKTDVSFDSSLIDSKEENPQRNRNVVKGRGKQIVKKRTKRRAKSSDEEDEEDLVLLSSGNDSTDSLIESVKNSASHLQTSSSHLNGRKGRLRSREKVVKETVTLDSSDEEIKSPEIKKRPCVESNELMSIKILWKYTEPIQKFQLRKYQKFQSILEHFAKLEGVPVEQVVLYGGIDKLRSIEPYDTPDSIGYTITDILEGGILSKESVKQSGIAKRYRDPCATIGEEIELRVQLEQIRSFPLLIRKQQKMSVLLVKVAEQLETEVDKVKLLLDGEVIDLESTPQDLDLEDGDVLDVLLSKPPVESVKSPVKSAKSPAPRSTKRPRRKCRK